MGTSVVLASNRFVQGLPGNLAIEQRALRARDDFPAFMNFVLRDELGRVTKMAPHHRVWHRHLESAWANQRHAAIFAPWAHGKTQVIASRVAWEIGRNPNIRIKIVCNVDTKAKERVVAIGNMMRSDPYRRVFPEIDVAAVATTHNRGRQGGPKVSQHSITVMRSGSAIDSTVQAAGILSSGIGGRADLLIFDDVVDQRNAIDEPALRQKIIDDFDMVWMSRLEPTGRAVLVGSFWHRADLHHDILNRIAWCSLRQWVAADFSCLEQEVFNAPKDYPIPRLHAAPDPVATRVEVKSSNIRAVGYDPAAQVLEVEFRTGGLYRYEGVPEAVRDGFLASPSKGKFFVTYIRGFYPETKSRDDAVTRKYSG